MARRSRKFDRDAVEGPHHCCKESGGSVAGRVSANWKGLRCVYWRYFIVREDLSERRRIRPRVALHPRTPPCRSRWYPMTCTGPFRRPFMSGSRFPLRRTILQETRSLSRCLADPRTLSSPWIGDSLTCPPNSGNKMQHDRRTDGSGGKLCSKISGIPPGIRGISVP